MVKETLTSPPVVLLMVAVDTVGDDSSQGNEQDTSLPLSLPQPIRNTVAVINIIGII